MLQNFSFENSRVPSVSASELISQPVSWCKVEALALRCDLVTVVKDLSPPPITVMSISLKTIQNPKTHHNEVRALPAENILDDDAVIYLYIRRRLT